MLEAIEVTQEVPLSRIQDLLCCAFEGGSNYWYEIVAYQEPSVLTVRTDPDKVFPHLDYPVNSFGALKITNLEGDEIKGAKQWQLDLRTITSGIRTMAAKYPKHFADFMNEDDDGTTGDVFLQCCLFGEVIYG